MIEVVFLGTSSMVPTKERNQSGLLITYGTEGILVDCGEGIQRQLKVANIPITKVTKILITHWHGDHTLGIPGLIQSLAASEYNRILDIYGPVGTKKHINAFFDAFVIDRKVEMNIHEVKEGIVFENRDFRLEAYLLNHGIETYGYNFIQQDKRRINIAKVKKLGIPEGPLLGKLQEGQDIIYKDQKMTADEATKLVKGKKISIIADTVLCDNCYKLAQNADLLICESTYSSKLEEKGEDYKHMTSKQAALVANKSNVNKLVLTHFSARYKSTLELNDDARTYFDNTECAYDFMKVKL
jgi:ribonuclease Z